MIQRHRRTDLREIGPTVRQTAELRRLCLSLREAKNRESEMALIAEFERAAVKPDGLITVNADVIRAGFRSLWRQGQYDRIVALAHRLPETRLREDERVLMYYLCAERRQSEVPADPGGRE